MRKAVLLNLEPADAARLDLVRDAVTDAVGAPVGRGGAVKFLLDVAMPAQGEDMGAGGVSETAPSPPAPGEKR